MTRRDRDRADTIRPIGSSTPQILRAFAARFGIALLAGAVLTGASIKVAYRHIDEKWREVESVDVARGVLRDTGKADDPGKPGNFLIVGSDSRAFVKTQDDKDHFGDKTTQTGTRSDSIMIAHVDPRVKQSALVSFPRDTWVTIPGCGTQKINAAFNSDLVCNGVHGGPQLLAQTIERNFNVPINHYLEVDFVGFVYIVNVLGHVDIYFPSPARDVETGLFVETGGCRPLDGLGALKYVRSREYEWKSYETGEWHKDPTYDLGRIRRQQYFIRTLMQVGLDQGLRRPLTTGRRLLDKTITVLKKDRRFDTSDMLRLAKSFSSLVPGKVLMLTVPTRREFRGGADGLALDQPAAEAVFASIRGFATPGKPLPTFRPRDITVDVLNGSGLKGAAGTALASLGTLDFVEGQSADADRGDYATTEVRVAAANVGYGAFVQQYLGGAGKVVIVESTGTAKVVVVLGRDFTAVAKPGPTKPSSTTAPVVTTSTTMQPPNPGNPPAGTVVSGGHQIVGCA